MGALVFSRAYVPVTNYEGGMRFTVNYLALLLALVIYTSAFIAEVVRAGILAVPKGQREAAHAIGLTPFQSFTKIIYPQAVRVVLPPMISQYLNLTKNSSLASLAGYAELFVIASVISNQTGAAIPIALLLIGSYLVISLAFSFVLNQVNARMALVGADMAMIPARPAPTPTSGFGYWVRKNLFNGPFNTILTLVAGVILVWSIFNLGVFIVEGNWELVWKNMKLFGVTATLRVPAAAPHSGHHAGAHGRHVGRERTAHHHHQRLLVAAGLRGGGIGHRHHLLALGALPLAHDLRHRLGRLRARPELPSGGEGPRLRLGCVARGRLHASLGLRCRRARRTRSHPRLGRLPPHHHPHHGHHP